MKRYLVNVPDKKAAFFEELLLSIAVYEFREVDISMELHQNSEISTEEKHKGKPPKSRAVNKKKAYQLFDRESNIDSLRQILSRIDAIRDKHRTRQ